MDLHQCRSVFDQPGPYLTLHLDVSRADEDGVERAESRWTTVRHELEGHDLDEALVDDIGARVRENTHVAGEVRRTIVANADGVLLDDIQAGHNPRPEIIDHGALPLLTPWLEQTDQALPFVLAVVDREGADVTGHRALHRDPAHQEQVRGETFYITKVPEGDWAQKQFQQTAENTWKHNAALVADTIRSVSRDLAPVAVFVVGETRARAEVSRALTGGEHQQLGEIIDVDAGGRADGASDEAMWRAVEEDLSRLVAERDTALLAEVDEARGQARGGAATGVDEVLVALAKAQVQRLLLDPAALEERTVRPDRHPGLPLPPSVPDAEELPTDRVLVAAAALSGADLTLLPASVIGGGGATAVLRWDD